ncbi:MAG: carbohydrate-binding domain-containing protein [Oscillospiraceae bacterium]|nr:carbohydrate-binding domain-containing protein [Oscillospiraceae bacterium]
MKKRIFSMIIALIMVVGVFPAEAFAEELQSPVVTATYNGETTEHTKLKDAFDSLAGTGGTITLHGNFTQNQQIFIDSGVTITVIGNGYGITASEDIHGNIFGVSDGSTLIFDKTFLYAESETSGAGIYIYDESSGVVVQNGSYIYAKNNSGIDSQGKVTVTGAQILGKPAVYGFPGSEITFDSAEGQKIELYAQNFDSAVRAHDSKLTMAGDIFAQGMDFGIYADGESEVFISGPIKSNLNFHAYEIDYEEEGILIKPVDGYTITESDVSFIKISDYNGGVLELREDGNIGLKFVHQHKALYGYEPVTENTHRFECECGETITEDCDFRWHTYNDDVHYTECYYCDNRINVEAHIFEGCYCTGVNCGYDIHEIEEWVASEEDTEIHTGICTKCEETIEEGHYYNALVHDEVGHWFICKCGLVYEETYGTHNICPDWDPYSGTQHYKYCDTCSYQIIEDHVDENADAICDKCEDEIHICIDEDGDHICDECQEFIEELCTDENGDHTCDGENCGEKMEWLCADENGDHTCDNEKCQRHMKELCSSEEETIYCDVCDRNFCAHDYLISCESLDDGTHSGICDYCGEDVTEDCYVWEYVYDEEKHYERCVCEYVLDEAEHTFEDGYIYKTSVTGHWLGCDDCAFEKHEEHKFSEGECICGTEENEVHDIYVGGKALENGEYIDNEGNITTQKPAGGYAYYKDGVLELNNYEFTGKGVSSLLNIDILEEQYAAVFATRDLTIKLVGENIIVETSTDEMEGIYGNSVFVIGDLTIEGEGKLSIPEGDDGIEVHDGTVTLKEGNVEIGTSAEAVTDDGLDIKNGNLVIDGGYLYVYSEDHGADVEGNFSMKKGTAIITAGDDGLNIMRDIKVSGGQMRVDAEDYGFDSEEGSIFVSGGEIYMTTNDEDGFDSGKKIEISGGNISIDATGDCFEAPKVTITGGSLELVAGKLAIDSDETIIDEMMEVFDSEDELIEDPNFAELDYAKIIKTETEHDWVEAEYTWAEDGSSCAAERVCKNDGNHKETVNAKVTSKVVKEATCEEEGETEYTANFDVDWAEKQTKTLADIDEKGHDWGEAEYTWAEDGSSCVATRVCKNDENHKETAEATEIKSATTKEPACEEKGETTYTATFGVDWAEEQTKTIADIDEKGHNWGEAGYNWAADGSSCAATRVCKNDRNHKETVNAKVTSRTAKEATCEEKGETEYTATFDVDWAEKQTKTLADMGEKGHDWSEAEYTWAEDGSSCVATRVCKNDGNHKETADATEIKSEVAKPATCTTMGDTRYEAVFAVDWAHDFKAITDIAIDEDAHEWGEWEVVTEPDYENKGLEKRVCNLDDKHYEEKEIAKLTVKPEETQKVEGPDDTREYVVVYQEDVIIVPDGLNVTVQDIRKDLWNAVKGGSLKGDVKVTFGEATIGYFNDKNEFVPIESDEFFKDGKTIDIVLRYPEGSDRNDKFEVYHYRDDGKVENCRIKSKTEKGLMITVDHLSPFAIAYESVDNGNNERPNLPSRPGKPSVKPDPGITIIAPEKEKEESNPNTGAPVVDLGGAGIVVLAAAAMFIGKKE